MAEFKISRLRYTWKGTWVTSTAYNRDDVVRYGGSTWVCFRQHTAGGFASDQTFLANPSDTDPTPAWRKMTDGYAWRSTWTASTLYNPGDLILNGGVVYLCVTSHTSPSLFKDSIDNWSIYLSADNWRTDWLPNTRYAVGDIVKYNAIVYRCIVEHLSGSTTQGLEIGNNDTQDDSTGELWQVVYEGIQRIGVWASVTRYRKNDIVKYGGGLLRCIEGHTSGASIDNDKFVLELPGFNQESRGREWNNSFNYAAGDTVRNGGYMYVANSNNVNQNPAADDNTQWDLLSKALNFSGDWSPTINYKTGDLVRRGGNLYVATANTTNDGSSLDYLDAGNWELIITGQTVQGPWVEDQTYAVNDVVVYLGSTYSCNFEHVASNENFPGDNGSGFNYWNLLLQSGQPSGLISSGDLLTYGLSRSLQGDGSTFGPTNVPLGTENQLVTVDGDSGVDYRFFGNTARVRYVSIDGVDDDTDSQRGINPDLPWRTIRYACEKVDDGFAGTTTIRVGVGEFEEITPIIIPARTVVLGTELRSTTIKAAGPIAALSLDSTYTISVLTRISQLIQSVLAGTQLSPAKTPSNPLNPTVVTENVNTRFEPPQFDNITGEEIFQSTVVQTVVTSPQAAVNIQVLIVNIQDYINFYINSTGSNPTLTGTNTAITSSGYTNAVLVLEANKEFLAAEAVAYMQTTFADYAFDSELCKRDVRRYIDAWKYDIIYTGNYKSLLAARYYRNAVLGSNETEDMFYCRDSTGVRNCTLKGIESILNPANAFELYQKPLGGAYVSLDPGWGPNDTRGWITNRSPYIQGVTVLGTAAVGQKIDGALHNGGNKSIVSNDFTQVISDGIGAWVTNNGRAELVSVFTYYAHIGYLAEDGGVIRAANGNCSYGTYGAIADGVVASEVPTTTLVNTRAQQAIVAAAFAGDFVDEIQILEWTNCGQNYTEAFATFAGAGINASVVFDDFRDNSVFQARLLDTNAGTEAVAQAIGGSGYVVAQNNAQAGNTTTITIATNDPNSITQYLGMRIILTSGDGTGQYGYITAYNNLTKVVNVSRESDDQPGWDHVQPGKPSADLLSINTSYRIEPRVIFSAPNYAAAEITVPVNTTWSDIVYGETTETYTNIPVNESGSGTTIDVVAALATFNIVKQGRDYIISINNAGAGYEAGQLLTIDGDQIGGETPINDIQILVTSVSDDSTNSILTSQRNTYGLGEDSFAASGRFVVISTGGSAAIYSNDGENWTDFNMPTAGNWKCLAAGDNKFVAIRTGSSVAASSLDGINWITRAMPSSRNWNSVTYGNGLFLAVAGNLNSAAYSLNGTSWTSTTLPTFGDSTLNEWVDVAYGKNKYVVIANSNNIVAVGSYNSALNTWAWDGHIMDVIADSSSKDWVSVAYGNDRFVAITSTGDVGYSFDGEFWLPATMPSPDSPPHNWKKIRYGQGVFFAIGDTGGRDNLPLDSDYAATSPDGIVWTPRALASTKQWQSVAFGSPYIDTADSTVGKATPTWIAIDNTEVFNKIQTGARAMGRVTIASGLINSIRIWDPGSGYTEGPTVTFVDPNNTSEAIVECRIADGVLTQPSWLNRGFGYRTASTRVTITGDGFADVIPTGKFITINDLEIYPRTGASLSIGSLTDFYTLVAIEELGPTNRGLSARIRVSPELRTRDNVQHLTSISVRRQFSQCRITGHDFLDIGTGNFEETNYPQLYSGFYTPEPQNEVVELNRGRVFYTSTDQSGNFRAGELFAVEQATGIVTISADFFDLGGLSELRLGGIRVGGTGAVVREFSTDPLFIEDSNNIVPTQRAIKAYLASRLAVGGSEIVVGSFIAGTILVGPDRINNTAGLRIIFPGRTDFNDATSGVSGHLLAQIMFFRSFSNT